MDGWRLKERGYEKKEGRSNFWIHMNNLLRLYYFIDGKFLPLFVPLCNRYLFGQPTFLCVWLILTAHMFILRSLRRLLQDWLRSRWRNLSHFLLYSPPVLHWVYQHLLPALMRHLYLSQKTFLDLQQTLTNPLSSLYFQYFQQLYLFFQSHYVPLVQLPNHYCLTFVLHCHCLLQGAPCLAGSKLRGFLADWRENWLKSRIDASDYYLPLLLTPHFDLSIIRAPSLGSAALRPISYCPYFARRLLEVRRILGRQHQLMSLFIFSPLGLISIG